ncbi:hypothetical protein ACK3TF_003942 [Chlorella vulgaris]
MRHSRPAWRAPAPSRSRQTIRAAANPASNANSTARGSPGAGQADTSALTTETPAASAVVASSDIQTRQLRLLPWQSSTSAAAPQKAVKADPKANDTSVTQTAAPAAGKPASAAGLTQRGSSTSPVRQPRMRGISGPPSSSSAAAARGSGADDQSVRAGSSIGSSDLKPPQQPADHHPGALLPALQGGDLAAQAGSAASPAGGSDVDTPSSASASIGTRRRRKTGPMSAERREAISRALQSKGAKSAEHKRSIARAMREAHARNPQLRRSAAGLKKRCGHCGEAGHNRKTCPQLVGASSASGAGSPPSKKLIIIEEEEEAEEQEEEAQQEGVQLVPPSFTATHTPSSSSAGSNDADRSSSSSGAPKAAAAPAGRSGGSPGAVQEAAAQLPATPPQQYVDLLPTRRVAPGMSLGPQGDWIFPLPRNKEECVAQAAQAVLRAWDDGIRRQAIELLLPQADASAEGGWPGGIRQQFRVAKPMVELLLLRLKQYQGLAGRITAEFLDEGDCVGAWQSERLGAVLFATAESMPDLRRIDDALSGERLTLVINPQWQIQGQVISDFGIGRARKAAERFVAALEEVYCLRRVRVFGDDVRILRCYPGQWQVHYVPPGQATKTVLLSSEDAKPTFQRLIELLKAVRGSRASKTWLDRVLTSSMGTFNECGAYPSPQGVLQAGAPPPGVLASQPGGAGTSSSSSSSQHTSSTVLPAGAQLDEGSQHSQQQQLRDIVTGEPISLKADDEQPVDSEQQVGKAPRDIRLEPITQLTKWLP